MAKQLLLIRHAEAETPYIGQRDFEREITSHGIISTSQTGKKLKELGFVPDIVLTSAAHRAKATAMLLCEQLSYPVENIIESEEIYSCNLNFLLEYVCKINDKYNSAILVNHNPNITYLTEYLTGESIYAGINLLGVANITFDLDKWGLVGHNSGKLLWYKELYEPRF
jgi:phosphohistidine phosphatase